MNFQLKLTIFQFPRLYIGPFPIEKKNFKSKQRDPICRFHFWTAVHCGFFAFYIYLWHTLRFPIFVHACFELISIFINICQCVCVCVCVRVPGIFFRFRFFPGSFSGPLVREIMCDVCPLRTIYTCPNIIFIFLMLLVFFCGSRTHLPPWRFCDTRKLILWS